jgi:hypothetical protein
MFNKLAILVALSALALTAGCATQTITAGPQAPAIASNKTVVSDFTDAAGNLNCAVAIGILPATDPAVVCSNAALAAFNLPAVTCVTGVPTVTPPSPPVAGAVTSFKATNGGMISAGTIAYIKLAQAKAPPITVSASCEQVLGKLQVMGLTAAANPLGTIEQILGLPQIQP